MLISLAWLILLAIITAFITGLYSQYLYWKKNYFKLFRQEAKGRKEGFRESRESGGNSYKLSIRRDVDERAAEWRESGDY